MNVKDFMSNYKRLDEIDAEIKGIVSQYESRSKYRTTTFIPGLEVSRNGVFQVELAAISIPFGLIRKLNEYMGKDCEKITFESGLIKLVWKF